MKNVLDKDIFTYQHDINNYLLIFSFYAYTNARLLRTGKLLLIIFETQTRFRAFVK